MAFLTSVRLPDDISLNAMFGPSYLTDIVTTRSGWEKRNQNWTEERIEGDVSYAVRTEDQKKALLSLFRVAKGKTHSFRVKDWSDYTVNTSEGRLGTGAVGTGMPTYSFYKRYTSGSETEDRRITTVRSDRAHTVYRNSTPVTVGAGAGQISIDHDAGTTTFVADVTKNVDANSAKNVNANVVKTVTGLTNANPGVVTAVGHTFVSGDRIKLENVGGMTEVNGLYFTVTYLTVDTFSIGVDTTGYGTYTTGGTATKYGITQGNPARVYSTAHGFITGDKIKITGATGMTQVNNAYYTITVVDANTYTLGVNGTTWSTYTGGATGTKYGITQTSPARVYSTAHGFSNGQLIHLSGATGMIEINGQAYTVTNAQTNYFDLTGIDATAYAAYTGSGVISKFPQPADALTFACEFDVPMRFDIDKLNIQVLVGPPTNMLYSVASVPLVEVRV